MSQLLKFRQYIDGEFQYWGYGVYADPTKFASPVDPGAPSEQYTNVLDKKGIKIYEGDIIKWEDSYQNGISEVEWGSDDHTYPAFDLTPQVSDELNSLSLLSYDGSMEVIGNIHENPELLK